MGYEAPTVASLYERLVRMCLSVLRGASADLILERAEDAGLQVNWADVLLIGKLAGSQCVVDAAVSWVDVLLNEAGAGKLLHVVDICASELGG